MQSRPDSLKAESDLVMVETLFPNWLQDRLMGEESFAEAYAKVPASERARLKACLAALFDWYGLRASRRDVRERSWGSGFQSLELEEPLEWCLIRVYPGDRSPPRLLAAVLPPVLARVEAVMVVAEAPDVAWSHGQLLALELAGIEQVFALTPEEGRRLDSDLASMPSRGAAIELGPERTASGRTESVPEPQAMMTRLPSPTVGIWSEGGDWDLEALAFAMPEGDFQIWSPEGAQAGSTGVPRTGSWEDFLASGFDTVFVPTPSLRDALGRAERVFGYGQEGSWIWPELSLGHFSRLRIALADSGTRV